MTTDPLAPIVMPGGDIVCPHCDSGGDPVCCSWHRPDIGPSVGMSQMVPKTWEAVT